MGFNLDDMMGKYKDFARGYLFYCRVTGGGVTMPSDHPYLVKSTQLPTHTLGVAEANWQGNKYSIPTTHEFSTFNLTFRADAKHDLRSIFAEWMGKCQDPVTNIHGAPGTIFGSLDLTQIDGTGSPVMSYSLVNAFPSELGEVSLDYGTKEISEFSVTFTYQYYKAGDAFSDSASDASV